MNGFTEFPPCQAEVALLRSEVEDLDATLRDREEARYNMHAADD